jgi:hypothetical protein
MTPPSRLIDDPLWRHRGNPEAIEHDIFGFRNTVLIEDTTALLTGSSHAYGTCLRKAQSWPILLQGQGVKIFNASTGAWGFMQFAMAVEKYLREGMTTVVLVAYTGFDIYAALKHSLDTRSPFAVGVLGDSLKPCGIDWSWKAKRDVFVKEAMKQPGATLATALDEARRTGFSDTNFVNVNGRRYYLEPRLRHLTTDIASDYGRIAWECSTKYVSYVSNLCREYGVRLSAIIMPTKEYAFRNVADSVPYIDELVESESRLHAALRECFSPWCRKIIDITPLYVENLDAGIFFAESNDGHPNPLGARLISEFLLKSGAFS